MHSLPTDSLLYDLHPPPGNDRGPDALRDLLATVAGELAAGETVTLSLRGRGGTSGLALDVPPRHRAWLWGELPDVYPGCRLVRRQPRQRANELRVHLAPDTDLLPLANDVNVRATDADPIAGILSRLKTGRKGTYEARVELALTQPRPRVRKRHTRDSRAVLTIGDAEKRREAARTLSAGGLRAWLLRLRSRRRQSGGSAQGEGKGAAASLLECRLSVVVSWEAGPVEPAKRIDNSLTSAFARFNTEDVRFGVARKPRPVLLTPAEVATLWHVPLASADSVADVRRNDFHELPPPAFD